MSVSTISIIAALIASASLGMLLYHFRMKEYKKEAFGSEPKAPDMTICPECGNAVFRDEITVWGFCEECRKKKGAPEHDQRHPGTWVGPEPRLGETAMGFVARTGQLSSQQLQQCQIDAPTTAHDNVCPCSSYGNPLCPLSSNKG